MLSLPMRVTGIHLTGPEEDVALHTSQTTALPPVHNVAGTAGPTTGSTCAAPGHLEPYLD